MNELLRENIAKHISLHEDQSQQFVVFLNVAHFKRRLTS